MHLGLFLDQSDFEPVIWDYSKNHTVTEGANITLYCELMNFLEQTDKVTIEWLKHVSEYGPKYGNDDDNYSGIIYGMFSG